MQIVQNDTSFGRRVITALGISIIADGLDYFAAPLFSTPLIGDVFDLIITSLLYFITRSKSATAYDSYWIAALSLDKNSTVNSDKENLTKSFKELVVETVESFEGMSGQIKLNKAGDRIGGNYDFWAVGKDNDTQSYEWKKEDNLK